MSSHKRNQVIEDFIDMYKLEPCLWRVKSKEYHDREKRDAAYAKLLLKLKELETYATKKSVIRKINSLRSNVRKEKKKRDMSMKSGASADNVYVSKLWYLNLFDFLGDQDIPSASMSNLEEGDGSEIEEEDVDEPATTPSRETSINSEVPSPVVPKPNSDTRAVSLPPYSRPNLAKKKKIEDLTTGVLVSVRDHFQKPSCQDDRYDIMGKSIAMQIRALEKRQGLIVEKRINDLLFEAEMSMFDVPNTGSYNYESLTNTPGSSRSTTSPLAAVSYGQYPQQTSPSEFVSNDVIPPHQSMADYLANYDKNQ
ncbi:uncharacterized protein LOC134538502 isoform X3 [Bacillus rossius redtenbacheri]|uniref:uncharacterized protein LOC134538502 isoform X3 n=1 Tax=Bacillus rossius redtenbacheri TaxID=93214 RepID=UPI002FDE1C22